jgi:hypothetical protein
MKKYTMQDFISQKIAVTFDNEQEQKRFLMECEKAGMMTCSNEKPTAWTVKSFTLPIYKTDGGRLVMMFVDPGDQSKVPFSSFAFAQPATTPSHSIHITSNGLTTHAVLKEGGKVVKCVKAVCSPNDTYDFLSGAGIAFDRLAGRKVDKPAEKPASKPEPQYREVKRKANAGDLIKLLSRPSGAEDRTTIGKEYKIRSTGPDHVYFVGDNGEEVTSIHERYVVLEPISPKPWKPEAGELVYIKSKPICGNFDSDSIVKIECFCGSGHPRAKDKDGNLVCLLPGAILPVHREDRPAKVGEWVEIVDRSGSAFYTFGKIVKCVHECADGAHLFNHGWYMSPKRYRVLVPDTEAAHA